MSREDVCNVDGRRDKSVRATAVRQGEKTWKYIPSADGHTTSSHFSALLSFPREQRERPPQPTNVGEDFEWDSTAPCFGTARQKVSLLLPSGMTHADECTQMDNRILYGV